MKHSRTENGIYSRKYQQVDFFITGKRKTCHFWKSTDFGICQGGAKSLDEKEDCGQSFIRGNIFYKRKMFSEKTFTPRFQTEMFSPLKCFFPQCLRFIWGRAKTFLKLDQVKMCVVHYGELFLLKLYVSKFSYFLKNFWVSF